MRAIEKPEGFKQIMLTLAREPAHPIGDRRIGYELIAPLDDRGHINAAQWRSHRTLCRVTKFRRNEPQEIGHLIRRQGGAWAFHYDIIGQDEDEGGYHFGDHAFVPGEYVTITERGVQHTYQVLNVCDLPMKGVVAS